MHSVGPYSLQRATPGRDAKCWSMTPRVRASPAQIATFRVCGRSARTRTSSPWKLGTVSVWVTEWRTTRSAMASGSRRSASSAITRWPPVVRAPQTGVIAPSKWSREQQQEDGHAIGRRGRLRRARRSRRPGWPATPRRPWAGRCCPRCAGRRPRPGRGGGVPVVAGQLPRQGVGHQGDPGRLPDVGGRALRIVRVEQHERVARQGGAQQLDDRGDGPVGGHADPLRRQARQTGREGAGAPDELGVGEGLAAEGDGRVPRTPAGGLHHRLIH